MPLPRHASKKKYGKTGSLAIVLCLLLSGGGVLAQSIDKTMSLGPPDKKAQNGNAKTTGEKKYQGLLLRQTSANQGALTIYLCPHRWAIKSSLICLIVDEEKDKIIAYTRQNNKYLQDSIAVGMKRFTGFRHGGDFDWGKFSPAGTETYLGEKCLVLQRSGRRTDIKVKNDVVVIERVLSCPRIKSTKVFQDMIYAIFDVDCSQGVPLKVSRMARSANPRFCSLRPVIWQDTTVLKDAEFPASEFDAPKGLSRVKTEIDLFNSDMENMPGAASLDMVRNREKKLNVTGPQR